MTCCVFLGPTLPAMEATAALDAVILPPVRQGDILRLVQTSRPRAIGIVDGYFRAVPACWHKEILFALGEGVHVFGAASMGALRAAELDGFGMVGVGRIYRAYRAGTFPPFDGEKFEDDDEVAVVHGPAETGYVAASEAMVNIRATLARAADAGVIEPRLRDALAALAKALHFPERCYPTLLAAARAEIRKAADLGALEAWLPDGRIDLKRADALEMLGAMRAFLETDSAPYITDFRLEASAAWRAALSASFEFATTDVDRTDELVLDEACLAASAGDRECRRAVERLAALQAALSRGVDANEPLRRAMLTTLRAERGLARQRDLELWLRSLDLDRHAFGRLVSDEARLDALAAVDAHAARGCLLDILRLEGRYAELRVRAIAKRDALAELVEPVLEDTAVYELVSWHALLAELPAPGDIDAYARSLGFADATQLARTIWRERAWRSVATWPSEVDSAGETSQNQ